MTILSGNARGIANSTRNGEKYKEINNFKIKNKVEIM